jgi:hypothetical protein
MSTIVPGYVQGISIKREGKLYSWHNRAEYMFQEEMLDVFDR